MGQNELGGDGDDGKDQSGKGSASIDGEEEGDIGGQMSDDQHRHLDPDHDEEEHTGDDVEEKHCPGGGEGAGKSFSATLGLVIHSAADGIALGASATSSKVGLGLVVFLAIFIHKSTSLSRVQSACFRVHIAYLNLTTSFVPPLSF